MTPDALVAEALTTAAAGLAAGEQPIGAVVAMGDDIIGRAYTQEKAKGRMLVHADLLAMIEADERLGWRRRDHSLQLAVNLEPCVMCLGAAMALRVDEVYYALESPGDGGAAIARGWQASDDAPWFAAPAVQGGIRREESRELFRRFCRTAPDGVIRRWAQTLVDLP